VDLEVGRGEGSLLPSSEKNWGYISGIGIPLQKKVVIYSNVTWVDFI